MENKPALEKGKRVAQSQCSLRDSRLHQAGTRMAYARPRTTRTRSCATEAPSRCRSRTHPKPTLRLTWCSSFPLQCPLHSPMRHGAATHSHQHPRSFLSSYVGASVVEPARGTAAGRECPSCRRVDVVRWSRISVRASSDARVKQEEKEDARWGEGGVTRTVGWSEEEPERRGWRASDSELGHLLPSCNMRPQTVAGKFPNIEFFPISGISMTIP